MADCTTSAGLDGLDFVADCFCPKATFARGPRRSGRRPIREPRARRNSLNEAFPSAKRLRQCAFAVPWWDRATRVTLLRWCFVPAGFLLPQTGANASATVRPHMTIDIPETLYPDRIIGVLRECQRCGITAPCWIPRQCGKLTTRKRCGVWIPAVLPWRRSARICRPSVLAGRKQVLVLHLLFGACPGGPALRRSSAWHWQAGRLCLFWRMGSVTFSEAGEHALGCAASEGTGVV